MAKKATKKQLGKGLSALLSGMGMGEDQVDKVEEDIIKNPKKAVQATANMIAMVPISEIHKTTNNPRKAFATEPLNELAESIRTYGLVQPITVRPMLSGGYEIISGERRWRASKLAGLKKLPAYIRVVKDDGEMLALALIENIQREDLNPIEIAVTYERLIEELNLTHEDLAKKLGKGRSSITNTLSLLALHEELKAAVKAGEVSMGHAKELKSLAKEEQVKLLPYIIEKELPVRATREILGLCKMHTTVQIAFDKDNIDTGHVKELSNLSKHEQEKVLQQVIVKGLSAKATKDFIEKSQETKARKKARAENPHQAEIDKLEKKLSSFFGRKVQLNVDSKSIGKLVIPLKDPDALDFILDKIREEK